MAFTVVTNANGPSPQPKACISEACLPFDACYKTFAVIYATVIHAKTIIALNGVDVIRIF